DGVTVDIDPETGSIRRKYVDGALAGAPARRALLQYVLARGGLVVANTHSATEGEQALPVMRFVEASAALHASDVTAWPPTAAQRTLCKGQLGSPIALGLAPHEDSSKRTADEARLTMKAAIAHLRHGLLYYYFNCESPDAGPCSWRDGPIDRMF